MDSAEEVDLDVVAVGDQETVSEAEEDSVMAEGLEEAASVVVVTASAEAGAASEVGTEDSAVVEEDLEAEMEDSAGVEEAEEVSEVVSAEVCT